jgi:hypothetical protein
MVLVPTGAAVRPVLFMDGQSRDAFMAIRNAMIDVADVPDQRCHFDSHSRTFGGYGRYAHPGAFS